MKIFKLFTFYFLLFTYFTALIFTFSRSAWLAIVVALTVLLIDAVIKRNLIMQKKVLEIILASGFLVFILFNQYSNLFLTRLTAGERLEIKSTSERLESYKNFLQLFKKNWFWGVGVGNYTLYNANLHNADQCGLMRTDAEIRMYAYDANCKIIPSWYYQPVHNVFLLVWAETGIAGLIFYLGLIVYLFIFCFRFLINNKMSNVECQMSNEKYQRQYTMNNIFNIAIILSLIILMLFDHWLWSLHFGVLFFWLVVGLMIRENGKETIVVL